MKSWSPTALPIAAWEVCNATSASYWLPPSSWHLLSGFVDRVRLFCTVYNPASGRYEIDNSLFIQIAIGFMIVLSIAVYLWRGFRPNQVT